MGWVVERDLRAYADRHHALAGAGPGGIRQRLFRLTEVVPRPLPGGRLREATEADVDLCAAWFLDFSRELGTAPGDDVAADSARVVGQRRVLLWEVGGAPVCMVGHSPPVVGVPRIAPVYTPAGERGRGYATAATAGVCQRLLERGAAAVVLFADRANPTATRVYARVGFRPVAEWDDWVLEY